MLEKYAKKLEEEIKEKDNLIKKLGNMLKDKEERIDKAIEYIELWHYRNDFRVNSFTTSVKEELLEILDKGEDKE